MCRKITSSVPVYVTETDEIVDTLCLTIKDDFHKIFGATDVKIVLGSDSAGEQPEESLLGFANMNYALPTRKNSRKTFTCFTFSASQGKIYIAATHLTLSGMDCRKRSESGIVG